MIVSSIGAIYVANNVAAVSRLDIEMDVGITCCGPSTIKATIIAKLKVYLSAMPHPHQLSV